MVVSTLMWHWVSRAGRGPGTDAGSGACGTRVRGRRGPWRRDSRGGGSARRTGQHTGRPGPGKATGYLLTRPYHHPNATLGKSVPVAEREQREPRDAWDASAVTAPPRASAGLT